MTVLGIETATPTCGAAIVTDDGVRAEAHLHVPRVHARRITPLIEDVLTHADLGPDGASLPDRLDVLDGIAVSMGPGSYTGLRIGVSTAKGWALAAGCPLVGVSTLHAHCARLLPVASPGDGVCGLIDARRDEVYAAAYRVADAGDAATGPTLREQAAPMACSVDDLPDRLGSVAGQWWVVGSGGAKSRDALARLDVPQTIVSPGDLPPSAVWVARQALPRLAAGDADDRAVFEPLYVKDVHATPAPDPF